MNKTIKSILLIAGTGLLVYGVYLLVMPEVSMDLGIVDIKAQDNTNAYYITGLGLAALLFALLAGKKG